jgi:hypothetical protein
LKGCSERWLIASRGLALTVEMTTLNGRIVYHRAQDGKARGTNL